MRSSRPRLATVLLATTFATAAFAAGEPELGVVRWGRDLDSAFATARAAGRTVPRWLEVALEETGLAHRRTARFATWCYWEGEARLGYPRELPADEPMREAGGTHHLHALAGSPLRSLALTPLQALRVNASIANGEDALAWLTPGQREQARNPGARVANRESAPACRAPARR